MKIIFTAAAIVFINVCVYAQASLLDKNFGKNGKAVTDFGSDENANSSVLQADGKIVVAGEYDVYPEDTQRLLACAVARYKSNGTPDSSFGKNGLTYSIIGKSFSTLNSVALQKNGKIVGTGRANLNGYYDQLIVLRYTQNGTIDSSFGENGLSYYRLPHGGSVRGNAVVIQPDDKIVVAGETDVSQGGSMIVIRFNENGSVDRSFGNNGTLFLNIDASSGAYALTLSKNKKIIVTGFVSRDGKRNPVIAVCTAEGKPDKSFGDNGIVITSNQSVCVIRAVALTGTNKIIIAGTIYNGALCDFLLMRYSAEGSLDSSFGINGYSITDLGDHDEIYSLVIQPDEKIIAAGNSDNIASSSRNVFALARYNSDGKADRSFGKNGIIVTSFPAITCIARTVLLQPDKKIIIAGSVTDVNFNEDVALTRYHGDSGEIEKQEMPVANKQQAIIALKR